ncbi:MAG: CHAP domain-containing protein [Solirubrobacteraceae bacterium]
MRLQSRILAALPVIFGLLCSSAPASFGFGGEFASPSTAQLPTPDVYNSAAVCQPALSQPSCVWSSLPPKDPNNVETYLNCAYYAAERRPDIETYAVQVYGYPDAQDGAWDWEPDAVKAGYPVSHTPAVGDIFVSPPGAEYVWVNGSTAVNPDGHVGYVEQVLPDGSFITSEGGAGPDDSGGVNNWYAASFAQTVYFIGFKPNHTRPPVMDPTLGRVQRHGNSVVIVARIAADSGTATAIATSGHRRRQLTVTPRGATELVFSGSLSPGRWSIVITWHPAHGYVGPSRLTSRQVSVAAH